MDHLGREALTSLNGDPELMYTYIIVLINNQAPTFTYQLTYNPTYPSISVPLYTLVQIYSSNPIQSNLHLFNMAFEVSAVVGIVLMAPFVIPPM